MAQNKSINHTPKERKALDLMNAEYSRWFNGEITVTDKVSFSMRTRIKQARKNYWGAFDTPKEPSGREKMWYPLTQWMTDLFYRNTNRGTKDIDLLAKRAGNYGNARIAKQLARHYFYKENFDFTIDDLRFRTGMDGTGVNKTIPGATGSQLIDSTNVDLLNFVIDPTAESIQKAPSVIELVEMDIDEYMANDKWKNKDKLMDMIPDNPRYVPKVRIKVRWGKMQENLLSDGDKNSKKWVESLLITSELKGETTENISTISEAVDSKPQVVNLLVKSPFERRPYEECWFIKVPGRWYGMGVPEMIFDNQQLANENWNIRFNNARLLKNGLFKARVGSGITQDMLSKIADGGVIPVKRMDDFEQLQIQDYRASSYEDEDRINQASQRVLGATPQAGGEPLPASTPATIGVINQQNAATSFNTIIENLDDCIARIVKYHWLPIIFDDINAEKIYRITGNRAEIEALTDKYAERQADKAIVQSMIKTGIVPSEEAQEVLKGAVKQRFNKFGKNRFIKNVKDDIFSEEFDILVDVGNSKFNKAEKVAELRAFVTEMAQIPGSNINVEEVVKEYADNIGIGGERFFNDTPAPNALPEAPGKLRSAQEAPVERTLQQQQERQPGSLISR